MGEVGVDLGGQVLPERAQYPDDDPPGKGFEDRFAQLDATMDGPGRLAGDLTPECAAAVTAVLEALGKKRGPEEDRTAAQRFHDALQEGCQLSRASCWLTPVGSGAAAWRSQVRSNAVWTSAVC